MFPEDLSDLLGLYSSSLLEMYFGLRMMKQFINKQQLFKVSAMSNMGANAFK